MVLKRIQLKREEKNVPAEEIVELFKKNNIGVNKENQDTVIWHIKETEFKEEINLLRMLFNNLGYTWINIP